MTVAARPPLPHDFLPSVPELVVTSDDLDDGGTVASVHLADIMGMTGDNQSPHLRWSGAPDGTAHSVTPAWDAPGTHPCCRKYEVRRISPARTRTTPS